MDERTDRDSDAVAAETVSRLCYWLIKSNFDIWNSASQASLTKMKKSMSRSLGHDRSSLLSSKDFQPQLEQQHVLICTDNTSVVSYINHQGEWRLHPESVRMIWNR